MDFFKIFLLASQLIGSFAVFTVLSRLLAPPSDEGGATDLARLAKKEVGTSSAFSSLNPNGSLLDRLDLFLLKNLKLDVKIEELHMLMGRPQKPTPLEMLHLKETLAAVMSAVFFIAVGPFGAIFGIVGFFIPDSLYGKKIQARQLDIMRNFPTMVDLLALTIEAGLDYMSAIERILKNVKPAQRTELENELQKVLNEVQLGYTRRDALLRLAMRTGISEVRSFVSLIIQSDELGTSLVDLLRSYAADMRFRRLNKAEKLAAQASTKMLIPLFVFIFPTVFIMMLAPMAKSLISGGLGF